MNHQNFVMTITADFDTGKVIWATEGTVINSITYKKLTEGTEWYFTLISGIQG